MIRLSALALIAGACADPALTKRVTDLETKVAALEKSGPAAPAKNGEQQANPDDEKAIALYREAIDLARNGDNDGAKAKLTEIMAKYSQTRVAQAAQSRLQQLSVVGSSIDTLTGIEWLKGDAKVTDGKATLLVFWEVWCPHCRREVPKLEATFEKYKGQGLNVIGLTKMSRGKTKEDVLAFADEQKLTYPLGKEDGKMSDFFGVQGVPAAAVVIDGKVVWRDHPARLTDEMIEGWLKQG